MVFPGDPMLAAVCGLDLSRGLVKAAHMYGAQLLREEAGHVLPSGACVSPRRLNSKEPELETAFAHLGQSAVLKTGV